MNNRHDRQMNLSNIAAYVSATKAADITEYKDGSFSMAKKPVKQSRAVSVLEASFMMA